MAAVKAQMEVPDHVEAQRKTKCPDNVLLAIYGNPEDKRKSYDHSLTRCADSYILPPLSSPDGAQKAFMKFSPKYTLAKRALLLVSPLTARL